MPKTDLESAQDILNVSEEIISLAKNKRQLTDDITMAVLATAFIKFSSAIGIPADVFKDYVINMLDTMSTKEYDTLGESPTKTPTPPTILN